MSSSSANLSAPSSPPRLSRKSPPPPKLNLDEFPPTLSSTTTNTSTNTASRPSTAFVFTSSRTFRNLHNHTSSDNVLLPPAQISSPVSPAVSDTPTIPPPRSTHTAGRPSLSPEQLARHSHGAVDARCIVSSNMRAAGFVPLSHSPPLQPFDPSSSPTPSAVPTPMDPPRFPPIVFISSSNAGSGAMWDYQHTLQYGLGVGPSIGLGFAPNDAKKGSSSVINPPKEKESVRPSLSTSQSGFASHSNSFSSISSVSSSASSLLSTTSTSSSVTTTPSLTTRSPPSADESGQRTARASTTREPLAGYPFPETPSRTRATSRDQERRSASVAPSCVAASPAMTSSTASGSITPLAASPPSSPESDQSELPAPASASPSTSTPISSAATSPPPSASIRPYVPLARGSLFKSDVAKTTRPEQSPLSITELCYSSPRAWYTDPTLLPPVPGARVSSESERSKSVSEKGNKGARRERGTSRIPEETSGGRRPSKGKNVDRGTEGGVSAAAQTLPKEVDDVADEKARHRGREKERAKDREREKAKKRERQRKKEKTAVSIQSQASSPTPSDEGQAREKEKHSSHRPSGLKKERERTRSTKEKSLVHTAYSSFSFPPQRVHRGHDVQPHTLGNIDTALKRERAREAGEHVKDQVLAHRERDREHARQTEQWSSGSSEGGGSAQSKRATMAIAMTGMTPAHSYATSGYAGGRGRGHGRGERPPSRGRSVSSASVSTILSDDGTMVNEERAPAIETILET